MVMLGFIPCADLGEELKVNAEASTHADHDSDHKDLCSPFCSCACCGATLAFFSLEVQMPFLLAEPSELKYPQYESQILQTSNSFWQPPKI
jgi:hypothetical protein